MPAVFNPSTSPASRVCSRLRIVVRVDGQVAIARSFIEAVQAKNGDAAAQLCADAVEVLLPGAGATLKGKDGVRQMIKLAPKLEQSARGEEQRDDEVRISTLTRAPGVFANYTTWVFVFEANKIRRLSFELRAAN
jgi:hypothetical protein